jgi:redox-sensitive bicupin YhaK (pirin superfamily)
MTNLAPEERASRGRDCPPCPEHPVLERIATRSAEVGRGFVIRRALPSRQRRMVGAWCFLDHAGPLQVDPGAGLRVGPHPHIGLQTFTWVIEGTVVHRDSLGNEQVITPGQVNLMTAGRGIAHAEDSAATESRGSGEAGRLHAMQLWIALPDSERHRAPEFRNYPDLPLVERGGFEVRVLAGSALGRTSPVGVYSPIVALDLAATAAARLSLPLEASFEHAALVSSGEADIAGELTSPGTLLYLGSGREQLAVSARSTARLLIIGGVPFGEDILLWWNFVARRAEEIEAATRDWNSDQRFGTVKGSPSPRLLAPDIAGLHLRERRT